MSDDNIIQVSLHRQRDKEVVFPQWLGMHPEENQPCVHHGWHSRDAGILETPPAARHPGLP